MSASDHKPKFEWFSCRPRPNPGLATPDSCDCSDWKVPGCLRIMLEDKTRSRLFLKDRRTEFIETKELKVPLAVEVEHSQIIGLVQTALDSLKMPAVALPSERHWNLKGDELANPPSLPACSDEAIE